MVTMGHYFDIRYGTQLADSCDDLGVIFASGLMHVFIIFSLMETSGSPSSSLCWTEHYESEIV